jgi:hypothetical protein
MIKKNIILFKTIEEYTKKQYLEATLSAYCRHKAFVFLGDPIHFAFRLGGHDVQSSKQYYSND